VAQIGSVASELAAAEATGCALIRSDGFASFAITKLSQWVAIVDVEIPRSSS
jgi:hypothetical protein